MSSLLKSCETYFESRDLYEVLKISKDASETQIRKAYHKLSLLVHPDKVEDEEKKEEATEKFQVLGKIYSVLSNKEKRAVYDETGTIDDEFVDENDEGINWLEFWRRLFKPVTKKDVDDYELKYKDSSEEENDLKQAYLKGLGDMDYIYETVPFVNLSEEPRIRAILQDMIDTREIPSYKQFTNEPAQKANKRKRKYEQEAKEAEDIELETTSDLAKSILKRQEERSTSFLDKLEAKYSKAGSSGKTKTSKKGKK